MSSITGLHDNDWTCNWQLSDNISPVVMLEIWRIMYVVVNHEKTLHLHELDLKLISKCFAECLFYSQTYCGLVDPYGNMDLGQHWFRWWLVAWRHQAIIWTNVHFSLVRFCGILLRTISHWIPMLLLCVMSLKIKLLKLSPRANELMFVMVLFRVRCCSPSCWESSCTLTTTSTTPPFPSMRRKRYGKWGHVYDLFWKADHLAITNSLDRYICDKCLLEGVCVNMYHRLVLASSTISAQTNADVFNTLRLRQNGCRFPDDNFKCNFLNEDLWISVKISMKFVPKGPINNIPALIQIMTWRRPGDKPLSEPIMVKLPTHICVTRP